MLSFIMCFTWPPQLANRHMRVQHPEQSDILERVQLLRAKFKVVVALAKGQGLGDLVAAVSGTATEAGGRAAGGAGGGSNESGGADAAGTGGRSIKPGPGSMQGLTF
jgi:hypothetical protein